MSHLLVIEDNPSDFRRAEKCAIRTGFHSVEGTVTVEAAKMLLENAQAGHSKLPDAILIDLDLGRESGFDLLRFRYMTPAIRNIPVMVWTELGDKNHDLCDLFQIQGYVRKWGSEHELEQALASLFAESSKQI